MPSPSGLLRGLYTLSELQGFARELLEVGQVTSINGAQKGGSFARLSPIQQGIELRAEINRLNGESTAKKVNMDLTGYK